jgi:hypothetical protein
MNFDFHRQRDALLLERQALRERLRRVEARIANLLRIGVVVRGQRGERGRRQPRMRTPVSRAARRS